MGDGGREIGGKSLQRVQVSFPESVFQDLGIVGVPISERGKGFLINRGPLLQFFKPVQDDDDLLL